MVYVHVTRISNLHPYECGGPGRCVHCTNKRTPEHDPDLCPACHIDDPVWLRKFERIMRHARYFWRR